MLNVKWNLYCKMYFILAARMFLYFSKQNSMQCIDYLPVSLSCLLAVTPEKVDHECSIILTCLCPYQCFAMKCHLLPGSLLWIVFAVKHWHLAVIQYMFIAIVEWSEISTSFLSIKSFEIPSYVLELWSQSFHIMCVYPRMCRM